MNLRPLNNTLIVKLDEDEWRFIAKPELIEIPDSVIGAYKKRANSGVIVRWGNRCYYDYYEGQRVFFSGLSQRPGFQMEDGNYRFVSESEVLAKDEDV